MSIATASPLGWGGVEETTARVTDDRAGALAVDVLLGRYEEETHVAGDEPLDTLVVHSAGLTTDEAIARAEAFAEESYGPGWTYQDWRAG